MVYTTNIAGFQIEHRRVRNRLGQRRVGVYCGCTHTFGNDSEKLENLRSVRDDEKFQMIDF